MIEQIQNGVEGVTNSVDKVYDYSQETQSTAETAKGMLSEVNQAMQEITNEITQIATATEEQSSVANEISENTHNIADLVDKGADNFELFSRSTDKIHQLSSQLNDKVTQFKV